MPASGVARCTGETESVWIYSPVRATSTKRRLYLRFYILRICNFNLFLAWSAIAIGEDIRVELQTPPSAGLRVSGQRRWDNAPKGARNYEEAQRSPTLKGANMPASGVARCTGVTESAWICSPVRATSYSRMEIGFRSIIDDPMIYRFNSSTARITITIKLRSIKVTDAESTEGKPPIKWRGSISRRSSIKYSTIVIFAIKTILFWGSISFCLNLSVT